MCVYCRSSWRPPWLIKRRRTSVCRSWRLSSKTFTSATGESNKRLLRPRPPRSFQSNCWWFGCSVAEPSSQERSVPGKSRGGGSSPRSSVAGSDDLSQQLQQLQLDKARLATDLLDALAGRKDAEAHASKCVSTQTLCHRGVLSN